LAVSTRSVWRLLSESQFSAVRIGKSVRITRDSVAAFISKGGAR
jgi:excisionase family DNA binding protein